MAGRHARLVPVDPLSAAATPPAITAMQAISDLPAVEAGEGANRYASPPQNAYQDLLRRGCDELTLHEATWHGARMIEIIRHAGATRSELWGR